MKYSTTLSWLCKNAHQVLKKDDYLRIISVLWFVYKLDLVFERVHLNLNFILEIWYEKRKKIKNKQPESNL